jgi:lipoprotein-anchoring transpeptidase ErfK/SrfK
MRTSLEQKTIRPGSLSSYSFYYSNRSQPMPVASASKKSSFKLPLKKLVLVLVVLLAGFLGFQHANSNPSSPTSADSNGISPVAAAAEPTYCKGNSLNKFVKVSIAKRHLWACEGGKVVYDAPVITGMEKYAATETPAGTYKIYSKQQDTTLTGSDETGSWKDPVAYWMPFLNNQYGIYGFHDATWRNNNEFGNVDPKTADNASHGCVELPLDASQWLYSWAEVGTTLTIDN